MRNFKFLYRIGAGTHGIVYLMKDRNTEKYVACKSFYSKYREYGKRELKILQAVQHKKIIRFHSSFCFGKNIYLICEYSNYGTFSDFLYYYKDRVINYKILFSIFSQIIDGLYYLHSRKIIHRDIKPDNILFHKKTGSKILEIRISDFSLATEESKILKTIVGTPYYIAPEIIMRKKYDCTVDLWSLAVCFYESIAKVRPFDGNTKTELRNEILHKPITIIPNCMDSYLSNILIKCFNRQSRPTSQIIRHYKKVVLYCNYIDLQLKNTELKRMKQKIEKVKIKIK